MGGALLQACTAAPSAAPAATAKPAAPQAAPTLAATPASVQQAPTTAPAAPTTAPGAAAKPTTAAAAAPAPTTASAAAANPGLMRPTDGTPKRGGTLRIAGGTVTTPHFDLHQGATAHPLTQIYNNLVRKDIPFLQ